MSATMEHSGMQKPGDESKNISVKRGERVDNLNLKIDGLQNLS